MSEDTTKDMPDSRSFEERVFARFDAIDARFNAIDERFNAVDDRLGALDLRLSTLEEKVERRLVETRPIWEAMQNQLDRLEGKFDRLNEKFDVVISDLYDLRGSVKSLSRRVSDLEDTRPQ
jgi:archaellum component FlaC